METQKSLNSHDVFFFFFFLRFHSGAEESVLALVRAPFKAGRLRSRQVKSHRASVEHVCRASAACRRDERMPKDSRWRLFTCLAKDANALAFTSKSRQKLEINDAFAAVCISFMGRFDHDSALPTIGGEIWSGNSSIGPG